jgi:hypothetical protein
LLSSKNGRALGPRIFKPSGGTWKGMATPSDESEKLLFAACSTIVIGDGARAQFVLTDG